MEGETSIGYARSRDGFSVEHIVFMEKVRGIFGLGQMQTSRVTGHLNTKKIISGTKILEVKNKTEVLNKLVKKGWGIAGQDYIINIQ